MWLLGMSRTGRGSAAAVTTTEIEAQQLAADLRFLHEPSDDRAFVSGCH